MRFQKFMLLLLVAAIGLWGLTSCFSGNGNQNTAKLGTDDDDHGSDDDDDTQDDDNDTFDDDTGDDDLDGDDIADDDSGDDDSGDDDSAIDDDTAVDDDIDDDTTDDDTTDDDTTDDDTTDDDSGDDDTFEPWHNPTAKGDAFKLFYKERVSRVLLSYNRFALVNDVIPAHTLGTVSVVRSGDSWEISLHPVDNNDIGWAAFDVYQAYKVFRTRKLALTLIRQFEGLAVAEKVSGHPGLTCREWEPGWTLTIEGSTGEITRLHEGNPVQPGETYSADLEQEVIDAFFADGHYVYRADPTDYYFTIEPILNTGTYAVTEVFTEMPNFLRVSDCCSSFMVSKLGSYQGYFWGNHNSRDNFPDYAIGYFTALEAMNDPDADADVKTSAAKAYSSGKNIGDSVVEYGYNLMTVSEFQPYDQLIVAGAVRPDGRTESQDLGSMNSCQMSYMAKALSTEGLHSTTEEVGLPGSIELLIIKDILEWLGITPPPMTWTCNYLDQAYAFWSWDDLLEGEFLGNTFSEWIDILVTMFPNQIIPLIWDLFDNVDQPEKSAMVLVYYAQLTNQPELLQSAKETLYHMLEFHRQVLLILGKFLNEKSFSIYGEEYYPGRNAIISKSEMLADVDHEYYKISIYSHIFGVGNQNFDPGDFTEGISNAQLFENALNRPDTPLLALMTDEAILTRIQNELNGAPEWNVERYNNRFPTDPPMHRADDHYEVVGLDGEFQAIPNISNQWFGGFDMWFEMPLCAKADTVLNCSWALLGCERPDLDSSETVDETDLALFNTAWDAYGEGASCSEANNWCDGADLDRNQTLDSEDQEFMNAAQGCWY